MKTKILSNLVNILKNYRAKKYWRLREEVTRNQRHEVQVMEWHGETFITIGGTPVYPCSKLDNYHEFIKEVRVNRTIYITEKYALYGNE